MADGSETVPAPITEDSPSVQAHLSIMQGVIERMALNSTSAKSWCITVVSAILVLVADKSKPDYAFLALIPTVLFGALDAYYLALEKAFREAYNSFVQKLHAGGVTPADLYAVRPHGKMTHHQLKALGSFAVWGFYSGNALLILFAWLFVLK